MKYLKKYKFIVFIIFLILILVLFLFLNKPQEVESIEIIENNVIEKEDVINVIKVEVKGAIKNSGVYELEKNLRVIDAINLSGGLLKESDTSNINLSEKLVDEMVITIPYKKVESKIIKVDIKGFINKPGVYQMKENDRIIDVIKLSGGLLDVADTSNINLSKKVFDEMVIFIPSKEEKKEDITNDAIIGDEQNKETEDDIKVDKEDDKETNKKISLNNATKDQLMTLPSIGESKALAIIEYRNNKKFETIEEITNVSGIGNSIYEKIKEYITL